MASDERDLALENVDNAIDSIIEALSKLDDNLPLVQGNNIPQKAALDNIKNSLEQGVKPYFYDIVKAMTVFGE